MVQVLVLVLVLSGCAAIEVGVTVHGSQGAEPVSSAVVDAVRPLEQSMSRSLGQGCAAYESRYVQGSMSGTRAVTGSHLYEWRRGTRYECP